MMASRFSKAFQLIALALIFSVAQLYLMAAPVRANTNPGTKAKPAVSQPVAEPMTADSTGMKINTPTASAESQLLTPKAASERMPLTAGTKTALNRIFSRKDMETRIAAGNNFLTARTSFADTFKSPVPRAAQTDTDDDDDDDDGKKGTWIAVGVIAAVLTIAVIGLRADRNRGDD